MKSKGVILWFFAIYAVCQFHADALSVETTARKRLGKKSFIQKKERGSLQKIASRDELKVAASLYTQKVPGSNLYLKGWNHWRMMAIESIRFELSKNLPHPADKTKFENLFFRLGVAADVGEMPSFSDPGARSGYALEFFCRARNLADLYMDALSPSGVFPENWVEKMKETPMLAANSCNEEPYKLVSLGGGPAFDFVATALAASFSIYTSGENVDPRAMKAKIFDYEEGWADLVEAMDTSTRNILQQGQLSCEWGGKCDITKSLQDPSNAGCLEEVDSTDLWTCQYCVAENANLLRKTNYIFFRELFEQTKDGSVVVLTETHPRIWPEFYKMIKKHCTYMQVGFNKNGRQMLLRKHTDKTRTTPLISNRDLELVKKFEEIGRHHERKINSGWERQEAPKIRSS